MAASHDSKVSSAVIRASLLVKSQYLRISYISCWSCCLTFFYWARFFPKLCIRIFHEVKEYFDELPFSPPTATIFFFHICFHLLSFSSSLQLLVGHILEVWLREPFTADANRLWHYSVRMNLSTQPLHMFLSILVQQQRQSKSRIFSFFLTDFQTPRTAIPEQLRFTILGVRGTAKRGVMLKYHCSVIYSKLPWSTYKEELRDILEIASHLMFCPEWSSARTPELESRECHSEWACWGIKYKYKVCQRKYPENCQLICLTILLRLIELYYCMVHTVYNKCLKKLTVKVKTTNQLSMFLTSFTSKAFIWKHCDVCCDTY